MLARDIMNPEPLSLPHDAPLAEVLATLTEHQISGAPVHDSEGILVGVVSLCDLVKEAQKGGRIKTDQLAFHRDLWWDLEDEMVQKSVIALDESLKARDLMTPQPFTVTPDATIREVANLMLERKIHRVLVEEEQKAKGIITTFDLVRHLTESLAVCS